MKIRRRPFAPLRPERTRSAFARLGLVALLALIGACAGLPDIERRAPADGAVEIGASTTLGRIARASAPGGEQSGFRLLPSGPLGLDARLQLARRAEASLDVQAYYLDDDETGRRLLRALRDAALRGVRVRLLLDDLFTGRNDSLFLALAAHRNVEVRLFNPFCCARDHGPAARFVASIGEWPRVNRRMHNKLFVADRAMALIGGRNVADEYFDENLVDLDALTVGFVVPPLQSIFDRYWDSRAAYPLHAIVASITSPEELRASFEDWTGLARTPAPAELPAADLIGRGSISEELDRGRLDLIAGFARVFADHADKPFHTGSQSVASRGSVAGNLFEAIGAAREEVVLTSPYFVPTESSLQMLRQLRARKVRVVVLTNSLASTDAPIVHSAYSRYRTGLLRMGVELYELGPSRSSAAPQPPRLNRSLGRLHAKLAVVDKRHVFIGSMNLDPRSATLNTELGSLTESPQLADEVLRIIDGARLQSAYRLRLTADGSSCEWLPMSGEPETVLTEEPGSTSWQRLKSWLFGRFAPVEQL